MNDNDPFAQIFPDTPRFEQPSEFVFDSDADGVIDPWDCQPFNPDADGLFGDVWKSIVSWGKQATKVDYGRAAARRAAVMKPIARHVRAAVARAPVHVSKERAAVRRAAVKRVISRKADVKRVISRKAAPTVKAVRAAVAWAPMHVSKERAAERRADVAAKFGIDFKRAAERRAAVTGAGVIGAPKQILKGIAGMGAMFAARPGAGVRPFAAYTPEAATTRRATVFEKWGWGAPKQILRGIAEAGEPFRERMASRVVAATSREQAKFQPGTLSGLTTGFSEKMSRVATVARGFESDDQVAHVPRVMQKYLGAPDQFTVPSVKSLVYGAEERLGLHSEKIPELLKTAGWAAKELGYGVTFGGPAMAVDVVGMVPAGVESIARRPDILPMAVAVGTVEMGKSMWHGARTSPTRLAGEFLSFGGLMKGTSAGSGALRRGASTAASKVPKTLEITVPKLPKASDVTVPKLPTTLDVTVPKLPTTLKVTVPTLPKFPDVPQLTPAIKPPRGLAPGKTIKFKAGMEATQRLTKLESPHPEPLDFSSIKALSVKGTGRAIEAWIKSRPEQRIIVGGSGAAKVFFKRSRAPGDVDIHLKNPELAAKETSAILADLLGSENVRVTFNPKWGSALVETRVGRTWRHAVDIHPHDPPVFEFGFKTQSPVEVGGIRYTPPGELLLRKASRALEQRRQDPTDIGQLPGERRFKDMADFEMMLREGAGWKRTSAEGATIFKRYQVKQAGTTEGLIHTYEYHTADPLYAAMYEYAALARKHPRTHKQTVGVGLVAAGGAYPYPTRTTPKPTYRTYRQGVPPLPYPVRATVPPGDSVPSYPPPPPGEDVPYDPYTPPPPDEGVPYYPPPPPPDEGVPYYPPPPPPDEDVPYDPYTPPPDDEGVPYYPPPPPPDDGTTTTVGDTVDESTDRWKRNGKRKEKPKKKPRRKPRGPFDWFLEHELVTLEGFLGGVARAPPEKFPEPDLGLPAGVKRAGGRGRRPGPLDVPPEW